jgi:2-keto-4-pentenoate hydratase/2-oxohepta-3-ene-1,7-dioic acid hydratase in catechol pathway
MHTKGITIMKSDDMVEIGIDGIGVLRHPVVREP